MVYITLHGAQHDIVGWLRLLEQEKVPHRCTQHVKDQSEVNIFVGISPEEVEPNPDSVYIFEPSLASLSEAPSLGIVTEIIDNDSVIRLHTLAEIIKTSESKIGYFHLHEMYHDYEYPVVIESGNCLTLCANLSSQLFLQGVGFKEVPFFSDNYYVEVLTTQIDKEKILQFMRKVLIKAVHMAGLPYIHVWYYPTDSESVFLFRQDVDYVDREGIDNLLSVSAQYNIRGTYFINMSGEEEFEDEIGHLTLEEPKTPQELPYLEKIRDSGNEIGNHGYWHYVFDKYEENYTNIKRCTTLLEDLLHVTPKGFSAPGGTWHLELAEAIEENNFVYASNACKDFGGFPYYPLIGGKKSSTLEIPFALVCLSFLGDVNVEVAEFKHYYLTYIENQVRTAEPIAIVGHPHLMGKVAHELLPTAFRRIQELHIPNMTVGEFADWWKRRERIQVDCKISGLNIEIWSDSSGFYVEVIYPQKRELKKVKDNPEIVEKE